MDENEAAKVILQEQQVSEPLRDTLADEPVPQIMGETAHVMLDGFRSRAALCTGAGAENRTAKQIVAAFQPQSQEKLVEVIQLFSSRTSFRSRSVSTLSTSPWANRIQE